MKKITLILILISIFCLTYGQQKTVKYWYIADTVAFKSVQIGDTLKNYKGEKLTNIIIENDTVRKVFLVENDTLKLFYKCVTKIEVALIKDNQCNGITLKGERCARSVDNAKRVYYCWQHEQK